jgi:cytochrome c oxidase cbb3-type subunit 3
MNCSGCHANGGGGMGPALMDDEWIYGKRTAADLRQHRRGAARTECRQFKYRLSNQQIWQARCLRALAQRAESQRELARAATTIAGETG